MRTYFHRGLHVISGSFHAIFDPTNVYDADQVIDIVGEAHINCVFISHGHADHCNALSALKSVPCIAHPATIDVIGLYQPIPNPVPIVPGFPVVIDGITIEAFDAGHCIGSLQFRLSLPDGKFVYTGDIDARGSGTNLSAQIIAGDYIAIETTLGDPEMLVEFKEMHNEVIRQFISGNLDKGKNAVLYCYPLGVAQEIVYLANTMEENGFSVLVDSLPWKICKIYEHYRGPIGPYSEINGAPRGKSVIIANLSWLKYGESIGSRTGREFPSMVISGKKLNNVMPHVELSFHSTFPDLVQAVKRSGARVIIPFHKKHAEFSRYLAGAGFDTRDPHVAVHDFC
jgi:putative mRNA 3-end processing factor